MLYAAEQLWIGVFTNTAINAQITALNAVLGTNAAQIAIKRNGFVNTPAQIATTFPALVFWVGAEVSRSEIARFGKRDTLVPVRLLYVSRNTEMSDAKIDIQVALEAMQTLLDLLPGQQYAATGRYCVEVHDPVVEIVPVKIDEQVIRQGGEMRFVMAMRTEGVAS